MEPRSLRFGWRRGDAATPESKRAESDPSAPEAELQARRAEIARMEEQALRERESLAVQQADLERRAQALEDRERNLDRQGDELKRQKRVQRRELERISGLTTSQAKDLLLADVEREARRQAGLRLVELDEQTRREAERRARSVLSVAVQRLAARHSSETTTRLVELPSDEMKGRIIGRDGRNIRVLEKLTGVDVIIDETPNAVMLSSFDGVRREVARITLERLIADGRITPASIEETYEQAQEEIGARVVEEGERAALEAHVNGLDPKLIELLGQLRFRTSYGQNVLDHLVESANIAALLAGELGASVETARRATLLHDIGKAVGHEVEGTHAAVGARIARRQGESEAVAHAIEAHHNEVEPRTVEAVIVQAADAISGARPGARGEALEEYVSRLRDLEDVASRNPAVERVLAMRAGREVRIIVDPGEVDDEGAALIAHETASAIEREVPHPGRIKVTVIRESRASAWAD
jgi:ribonucrease Y